MRIFPLIILGIFISVIFVHGGHPALSQKYSGYCDKAQSTADTFDCLHRHKETIQERLVAVYEELLKIQNKEEAEQLSVIQKMWLSYRDTQCAWETKQVKNPSMQRIYELACLSEMTDQRTDILASLIDSTRNVIPREFGENPRWMNVLAHDYPDVFWRYGSKIRADLDCDNDDEYIMSGVYFSESDKKEKSHNAGIILSISENPQTGKPRSNIIKIPVFSSEKGDKIHFCKPDIHVALVNAKNISHKNHKDNVVKSCGLSLKLTDGICLPVIVFWNGKNYEIKK